MPFSKEKVLGPEYKILYTPTCMYVHEREINNCHLHLFLSFSCQIFVTCHSHTERTKVSIYNCHFCAYFFVDQSLIQKDWELLQTRLKEKWEYNHKIFTQVSNCWQMLLYFFPRHFGPAPPTPYHGNLFQSSHI